jgi:drug/metabolite transporter (DMT)-like permease
MFILSFAASGFRINIHLSIWTIIALIFLGSIGGYLAILAETYSLKYIDPSRASIIFTLEPIFALIFSVIFIKEQITLRSMIGAMLIFISIVLASTNGSKNSG